jgi:hypothetical protein
LPLPETCGDPIVERLQILTNGSHGGNAGTPRNGSLIGMQKEKIHAVAGSGGS